MPGAPIRVTSWNLVSSAGTRPRSASRSTRVAAPAAAAATSAAPRAPARPARPQDRPLQVAQLGTGLEASSPTSSRGPPGTPPAASDRRPRGRSASMSCARNRSRSGWPATCAPAGQSAGVVPERQLRRRRGLNRLQPAGLPTATSRRRAGASANSASTRPASTRGPGAARRGPPRLSRSAASSRADRLLEPGRRPARRARPAAGSRAIPGDRSSRGLCGRW